MKNKIINVKLINKTVKLKKKKYMCLDYSRRDKRLRVFMVEEAKDISDGYS